jgi:uncharacterized membrane protein
LALVLKGGEDEARQKGWQMARAIAAVGRRESKGRYAKGLSIFSIGLGLVQLTAPRALATLIGIRSRSAKVKTIMRLLGARELGSGIGLLLRPRATQVGWLRARFAGDLVDLVLLGRALRSLRTNRRRIFAAWVVVLEAALLDFLALRRAARSRRLATQALSEGRRQAAAVITIARAREEVYRFWRELRNLPLFMTHVEEVQELDDRRSHWKGNGFEWDSEITVEVPNELLAWRNLEPEREFKRAAELAPAGTVRFTQAPDGKSTEVRVEVAYEAPEMASKISAELIGRLSAEKLKADLRRLKQLLEVGEVVHSDASIHRGLHPARPVSGSEAERELQ